MSEHPRPDGAKPAAAPGESVEPDPRWSLANERTLLAYVRTSLALLVAGLAVGGSYTVTDTPAWIAVLGLPLIAMGAIVAVSGRRRFLAAEDAMRHGHALAMPPIVAILPWGIASVAAIGLLAIAVALAR